MLLTSVILILQEILEAALIISVLLAFSVINHLSRQWIKSALILGIISALGYASQVERVSEWFDYVGLEIVNAAIQFTTALFLVVFASLRFKEKTPASAQLSDRIWQILMALIVCLAIAREGFEILLYESGFFGNPALWSPVFVGSLIGAGIGVSVGALLYYSLVNINAYAGECLALILLALFTGNMAAQGALLLIQADFLPSGQPLWNSSWLIAEDSMIGQLLYALIGYEASPTAIQAGAYGVFFTLMLVLFALRWPKKPHSGQ
ncbi:MAG: FTR1 family protein [Porticoccaceae bacterium]|nr:FTR1 family protein [Porticoccaceae bacterium]